MYVCPNDHPMPVVVPVKCTECDARVTYEPAAKGIGAYQRGYDQAVADQAARESDLRGCLETIAANTGNLHAITTLKRVYGG